MKRITLYILVCMLLPTMLQAQESNIENKADSSKSVLNKSVVREKEITYPRLHWGFFGGGGTLGYVIKGDNLSLKNDPSFGGGLFFELKFAKWIGLELGGSYTLLSGKVTVDNYSQTYTNLKDDEGDKVDLTIGVKNLKETITASVIEIPVSIRLEWNPGKWTLYLKPGVAYTMFQTSNYKQTGTYTRTGYYPDFGLTFSKLSAHGFYTGSYHSQDNEKLDLKSIVNPFISAGIIFPGEKGRFYIEGRYYPESANIAKPVAGTKPFDGPGYVALPSNYAFSSATSLSDKISLGGFMVQIGFRFR